MDSNWKKLICVLILQIAICVHGRAPKIEDNNRWAIERQYTAPRTPPRELRFCVDPEVEKIFDHKRKCLGSRRIVDYIGELRDHDSSEYSRSNELFAYHYFVESPQNTLRTNCEIADFEYIPFLPLHWVRKHAPTPECSYTQLIKDIQRFWAYKSERDKTIHYSDPQPTQAPTVNVVGCCGTVVNGVKSIFTSNKKIEMQTFKYPNKQFIITSTFNLRTEMGTGMPSTARRGPVYDTITNFVTSTYLGHYERFPQCPDLLRKGWKGTIEIPYIPLTSPVHRIELQPNITEPRSVLFAGRLLLYGPERVCSVRSAVAGLSDTWDTLMGPTTNHHHFLSIVNVSESISHTGVRSNIVDMYAKATFCIIAKGDSYSTGAFYTAIDNGCIPVVISDWFVFAYPWMIPYHLFVIRLSEQDFLKDPVGSMYNVLLQYEGTGNTQIIEMRKEMYRWRHYLSSKPMSLDNEWRDLWISWKSSRRSFPSMEVPFRYFKENSSSIRMLSMELFMTELEHIHLDVVPQLTDKPADRGKTPNLIDNTKLYSNTMVYKSGPWTPNSKVDEVYNGGRREVNRSTMSGYINEGLGCDTPYHCSRYAYTVPAFPMIYGDRSQNDKRSHLCRNTHRLIGQYKMVYFMKCVRILWPLSPGKFKNTDKASMSHEEAEYVLAFHKRGWAEEQYPVVINEGYITQAGSI